MKIDGGVQFGLPLSDVGEIAITQEKLGYSGFWSVETMHDPFLPLVLAADRTTDVELGTSIAVAFARNPMTLAYTANDLQAYSGRFILGLGSQVKAHITRRFSMEWSAPAARMREMIEAIRAIWESWATGTKLDFRGDFYQHTLMTPFFNPGPNPHGPPKIFVAGVGPKMTEVAGEVADGFICHAFTTERYLREVTLPALQRGREKAGKTMEGFEVSGPSFVVTGNDDAETATAAAFVKQQIAFYGSTPAYRSVLELEDRDALGDELTQLSKSGGWAKMGDLIDDETLHSFAIVAEPEGVAAAIRERYGDVIDRLSFYVPFQSDPARWASVLEDLTSNQ